MTELLSGILGITDESADKEEGVLTLQELKKAVVHGRIRAEALMNKVVLGERISGKRLWFGERLIRELNRRVMFYHPGTAGEYRIDDETMLGGFQPAKADDLHLLMYKFGIWLTDEVNDNLRSVSPSLTEALRIAAAAHYGLTHILHPFDEGNGRTARVLINGILMFGTDELRVHKIAIPPIPLIREDSNEIQIAQDIEEGREPKIDPYIKAIIMVRTGGMLNPLELFFATIWAKNMEVRLAKINREVNKKKRTKEDNKLIGVFNLRLDQLRQYIVAQEQGKQLPNQIPDYFAIKHIHK